MTTPPEPARLAPLRGVRLALALLWVAAVTLVYLAAQGLMRQKMPEQLEIVDQVPRNPTGKILKDELRRRFASR